MNPNDVGKKKIMRKEKERDFKNSLKTETYCNMSKRVKSGITDTILLQKYF